MAAMTMIVLVTVLLLKFCTNAAMLDVLTFECQVTGGFATVWTGTALTCTETNNEIIFLHSRFNNESTKFCSNRSIVGESIEVLNENIYISWLNVTLNPSLIGETVKCEKDNGTDTSLIANFTLPNDIANSIISTDIQHPGVQSAPLKVEIVIATVGVCFTLFLVGVVLAIILGHKIKIKSHKPESKDLNTEESPVDYHSQMMEQPRGSEPIFQCVPSKTMTGPDGYSLCVLNNTNASVIVTNSNYSYLEDPEDTPEILEEKFDAQEQEFDAQSEGVNRRSGCVRLEDESLDLDSLLIKLHGRVDTEWYAFGTAIGIPAEFLDSLKGYPDRECMVEMLDYWLRHHPDQPTWKEIADAIEDIHDYLLAKSIKGVYDLPTPLMEADDRGSVCI